MPGRFWAAPSLRSAHRRSACSPRAPRLAPKVAGKTRSYATVRALESRLFEILQPEKLICQAGSRRMLEQQYQNPPEEFAEGQMVRDDDAAMMLACGGIRLAETDEISHVEGQGMARRWRAAKAS